MLQAAEALPTASRPVKSYKTLLKICGLNPEMFPCNNFVVLVFVVLLKCKKVFANSFSISKLPCLLGKRTAQWVLGVSLVKFIVYNVVLKVSIKK